MRAQNTPSANIRELQQMLRSLTQAGADITLLTPDGIYGPETRRAVEEFQNLYGLPVTGEADSATWNRLVQVLRDIQHGCSTPAPIMVLPAEFMDLGLGDEEDAVYFVQIMLNALAKQFGNLSPVAVSGKYDNELQQAVKAFQKAAGLPCGGTVDRNTWNRMAALYNQASQCTCS